MVGNDVSAKMSPFRKETGENLTTNEIMRKANQP